MRRVLTGVAAIALTCAAGTMAMAQTTTPTPQTTTTNQSTTNQSTTNYPANSNEPSTANNGNGNAMNASGTLPAGAPTTQNLNAPGMVPVHPANWQYDVMARQYHWNSPPSSTNVPNQ